MRTTQIRYGLPAEYAVDVQVQEGNDEEFFLPYIGSAEQYKRDGYCIIRGMFLPQQCDKLVEDFRKEVRPYEGGLFRQISMLRVPHKFKHGLMINGFLNTQDLTMFPNFRKHSIDIIASNYMQVMVRIFSGWSPTLVESTFWESTSVGTPLHRDGDYVTSARGILTGMWVALENIGPESGRLCLVPKSHRPERWNGLLREYDEDVKIPTGSLRLDLKRRFEQGAKLHKAILGAGLKVIAPVMNKGDAIFWDGMIVHGSLPPTDGATRYSIAGHYIPYDDALVKHGRYIDFEYQVHNGMKLRHIPEAAEIDTSKGGKPPGNWSGWIEGAGDGSASQNVE